MILKRTTTIKIMVCLFVIFLIITNPSLRDFKEYKGVEPEAKYNLGARKDYNFILFSIYEQADDEGIYRSNYYYIGIIANFFVINK